MKPTTIRSRYYGPTDTVGSRLVARGGGRQATMGYDHALSLEANYEAAALALAHKLGLSRVKLEWDAGSCARKFTAD